jgi:hypothetical protein
MSMNSSGFARGSSGAWRASSEATVTGCGDPGIAAIASRLMPRLKLPGWPEYPWAGEGGTVLEPAFLVS